MSSDFVGLRVIWPPDGTRPPKHDKDIIFVHGLHYGSVSQWRDKEGVCWPAEHLSLDLENARIFAFGYDPTTPNVRSDGFYRGGLLFKQGEDLWSQMKTRRKPEKIQVPITLVGHGTGAIVIRSALCISHVRQEDFDFLLRKTRNLFLIDPPPADLNWDAWKQISEGTPGAKSTGQWKVWSAAHEISTTTFNEIARYFNVTALTSKVGGFVSASDYRLIIQELQDNTAIIISSLDEAQRIRLWLERRQDGMNVDSQQRNLAKHLLDTGEWLFQEAKFRKWASLDKSFPIIWLVGPEGCGKSVLCSLAVERMRKKPQEQAVVNLMITLDKPRSEYHLVVQIAMQLLEYVVKHRGGVAAEALLMLPKERVNDKKTFQIQDLIRVLISQCPAVFVFIDGLDEVGSAEEQDRRMSMKVNVEKTERPLHSVVYFMANVAREELGAHVRLWYSSKHTVTIRNWMKELGALELPMNKHAVAADIAQFIEHRSQDNLVASAKLKKATQNNFLLASIISDERGQSSLLNHRFEEGAVPDLSSSIRMLYQEQLDRLQLLSRAVPDDDKENSPDPWHIISLVAHAKRPLRMVEIQEALAILQVSSQKHGLITSISTATDRVNVDKVQRECWPFIDFHPTEEQSEDGYLRLVHASAFKYLRECSRKTVTEIEERTLSSSLIAKTCLIYLSQQRYRDASPRSMETSSFYAYAAKYWHGHLEEADPDPQLRQAAIDFMTSAQFLTMTRFQSLFFNRHFSSHLTNSSKMAQTDVSLPDCASIPQHLGNIEGLQHLVHDYEHFLNEWSDYLQHGTTCSGPESLIGNCFWGALGTRNALRMSGSVIEENQSFLLTPDTAGGDVQQHGYMTSKSNFYDTISDDGSRISVWQIPAQSDDDNEVAVGSRAMILRDSWYIDCDRPPFRYGAQEVLSIDAHITQMERHLPHSPRDIPLIPNRDTVSQVPMIHEYIYGGVVRIGRHSFHRKPGGTWIEDRTGARVYMNYWDSVAFQDSWNVYSHRKQRWLDEKKSNQYKSSKGRVGRDVPLPGIETKVQELGEDNILDGLLTGEKEQESLSPEDAFSSDQNDDSVSQASQPGDNASESESESHSEDSTTNASAVLTDFMSSAEELPVEPSSDRDLNGPHPPDDLWSSSSAEEVISEASTSSAGTDEGTTDNDSDTTGNKSESIRKSRRKRSYRLVNNQSHSMSAENSDADDEDSASGSEEIHATHESGQPKHITSHGLYCDLCSATIVPYDYTSVDMKDDRYYQCILCANYNCFDICSTCFGKGAWCKDRHHLLSECLLIFSERRFLWRDGISRNAANPLVKIVAGCEVKEIGGQHSFRPSFRYGRRQATMLHNSQSIVHPLLPLLVYPLDGRKLLFGNLETNTYFIFKVPFEALETAETGLSTCIPISVELRFSPCGKFIHVLRFTARNDSLVGPIDLRVVLFTIALSQKDPCSGVPRILLHRQSSNLGSWPRMVPRLPYTVTWTVPHVYISMSTGFLGVLRFVLHVLEPSTTAKDCATLRVYEFSRKVALPRSARSRSIHFFPSKGNASIKIILGSLHGAEPQPPIVVYLKASEQEEWLPVDERSRRLSVSNQINENALLEDPFWDEDAELVAKATQRDEGAPILEPVMPIREQLLRTWQTNGIYCASCFELGIRLGFFRPHPKIQFQYLDYVPTAADAVRLEWRVAPSVFLEALKKGCQFCCYIAVRTLSLSHIRQTSQFVGSGGVRCCAKGSVTERRKEIEEVIDNINNMSWKVPRENQVFKFLCEPQHWNIEDRSFDKLIITLPSVQVGGIFGEKGFAPTMLMVRGENELGETSTITTFIHRPDLSHPGTIECVLELHAPSNDAGHHLIDTRPLTTSRGEGDNLKTIKSWLNLCRSSHAFCQQQENVSAKLPTRLVEIVDSKIIRLVETAGEFGQYVALSYCWGHEPTGSNMTQLANLGIRLNKDGVFRAYLPATIRDAITVTERLGIKYIWIDSLCIVQDDRQDKHAELGRMSQYYRNSFLTIAASTPSATTGFIGRLGRCEKHPDSPLPRDLVPLDVFAHVHDSKDSGVAGKIYVREENPYQLHEEPINKRAWTLQECILAPRVVLFGSRVIWFCQHMTHSDGGVEDWSFDQDDLEGTRREFQVQLCRLERGALDNEMFPRSSWPMNETRTDYSLWHRLVGTYSRRALSYPADKLPAISAVAAEFSKLAKDTYLAGLWRLNLPRDLLWTTLEAATHRSKTWRAPTWSWASVDDAIVYKQPPPESATLLAEVLEVESVPLTEVAPFGEVERGSLVISAPSFPVTIEDEESHKGFSESWLNKFKLRLGKSEREMLFDSLKRFVETNEKDAERGEKKEFQLPDEFFVVCIYGKRDELFRSNEAGLDLNDTTQRWSMWGLVLTQVVDGSGEQSFERLLSFSEILVNTDESFFSSPREFRII